MAVDSYGQIKLISVFIESALYGTYILTFILTCWVLVDKLHEAHLINTAMILVSAVMFLIATVHMLISYVRVYSAFVRHTNAPGQYLETLQGLELIATALYMSQTLIGDGLVLWRAYKVWGSRTSIVILPLILLFGSAAVDIRVLFMFNKLPVDPTLTQWFYAFPSFTLATNLIGTGLISYRIWNIQRKTVSLSGRSLRPTMYIVMESGAIYSVLLTLLLGFIGTGILEGNLLLDSMSSLVGLVSSMVVVRIGISLSRPQNLTSSTCP